MNPTHIHLLLNHFPIVGTLVSTVLLAWGMYAKQDNIKKAAAVMLAAMALIAIPVYLTGEPAEEAVENLPGVSESLMEIHEEAATIAIWLMELAGVASLMAAILAWKKHAKAGAAFTITFVIALASFAAMARTGYYGGKIRHTEIRANGNAANEQAQPGASAEQEDDD